MPKYCGNSLLWEKGQMTGETWKWQEGGLKLWFVTLEKIPIIFRVAKGVPNMLRSCKLTAGWHTVPPHPPRFQFILSLPFSLSLFSSPSHFISLFLILNLVDKNCQNYAIQTFSSHKLYLLLLFAHGMPWETWKIHQMHTMTLTTQNARCDEKYKVRIFENGKPGSERKRRGKVEEARAHAQALTWKLRAKTQSMRQLDCSTFVCLICVFISS